MIHNSFIDLAEREHLDKARDSLVARILELVHTENDLRYVGIINEKCYTKTEIIIQMFKPEMLSCSFSVFF